jgi:glycosyltransferase involved in cell wall biosynthesis
MIDRLPGMTILLPTYNRAPVLRRTLQAIREVDGAGIDWDIVVIDNNSSDGTASVMNEFRDLLPLTCLREVKAGKNSALNKALREHPMKELIVFTDDDVTPDKDWLSAIASVTVRRPDVAVFGGRIRVDWPQGAEPPWARADWIKAFGFSHHDRGEAETYYSPPACPFGPNYWIRRRVLATVPFFDETIGPRPGNAIMGSETSFLMDLHRHGFAMLYCPAAQVEHRIEAEKCTVPSLRRRGFRFGRGQVRLFGLRRRELYLSRRRWWWTITMMECAFNALRLCAGFLAPGVRRRCEITVDAMITFGALAETILQVRAPVTASSGKACERRREI